METIKEFYLDAVKSANESKFCDNFVEVFIDMEHDEMDHAFGVEKLIRPYIKSVSLNGVSLDGAQKRLIVELLGGEEGLLND